MQYMIVGLMRNIYFFIFAIFFRDFVFGKIRSFVSFFPNTNISTENDEDAKIITSQQSYDHVHTGILLDSKPTSRKLFILLCLQIFYIFLTHQQRHLFFISLTYASNTLFVHQMDQMNVFISIVKNIYPSRQLVQRDK